MILTKSDFQSIEEKKRLRVPDPAPYKLRANAWDWRKVEADFGTGMTATELHFATGIPEGTCWNAIHDGRVG